MDHPASLLTCNLLYSTYCRAHHILYKIHSSLFFCQISLGYLSFMFCRWTACWIYLIVVALESVTFYNLVIRYLIFWSWYWVTASHFMCWELFLSFAAPNFNVAFPSLRKEMMIWSSLCGLNLLCHKYLHSTECFFRVPISFFWM